MKKKILSLAIVAMSMTAFTGFAQKPCDKAQKECTEQQCCKKEAKGDKGACLFEGLTLTDAQKAQLKELNQTRRAARKEAAESKKADKQRNDSTRLANRRAEKQDYLKQVKEIVGPEQYVIFLENFYINGGNKQKPAKATIAQGRMAKGHGMRDAQKMGKKGDRPFKGQAKAKTAEK